MTSSILMRWTGLINCAGSHPHFVMTSNQLKWNCNPCYCQGSRSRPRQCVGAWRSAKLGESVWQDTQQGCCGGSYWSRKVNFFWQSSIRLQSDQSDNCMVPFNILIQPRLYHNRTAYLGYPEGLEVNIHIMSNLWQCSQNWHWGRVMLNFVTISQIEVVLGWF